MVFRVYIMTRVNMGTQNTQGRVCSTTRVNTGTQNIIIITIIIYQFI